MVDLDELDRLHASLESGQIEAVIVGQAREVVTLLRAYPALAAEVRRLEAERYAMEQRAIEAEALYQPQRESEENLRAQLEKVRSILTELDRAIYDYRACREGVQTQGGHNLVDRKFTAQRLTEALAKVPR